MASSALHPFILLVEDSDDDAFFFRRTVDRSGYPCRIVQVSTGDAALDALERFAAGPVEERPDLVFLDLKLPGFDGFEILAWVRERRFSPPLAITVLSGSEDSADVGRAKALGAQEYFAKPLSIDQLRARLSAWEAGRALRSEMIGATAISAH
jgi:DNA-binding response OmpR family regulator